MTCIVGVAKDGTVWIGGDSAGVDGWHQLSLVKAPKVFRNGPFLFGYTTSFRMGQLLQFAFTPPAHHPDVAIDRYMATEFLSAWRTCLSTHGFLKKSSDREEGGTFLAAYRGRLFKVQEDHAVLECAEGYDACGSGWMVAIGALHATPQLSPEDRVRRALIAAEAHISSVRGPFVVESAT